MRKSIDGLAAIAQQFKLDFFLDSLFLFCGRRRDRLKALLRKDDGFVLLYKQLVCTGAAVSKKIALYTYKDSRRKTVVEELLGNYTEVVQTDGYQSYGSGKFENAGCHSHLRRKFLDCIPEGYTTFNSAQIVALIDKAFAFETQAKKQNILVSRYLRCAAKGKAAAG